MRLVHNQNAKPDPFRVPLATPQAGGQHPPRFGCRVFAYLSAQPYAGQDEFVRQCLLTGGNSLKRQNQLRLAAEGDVGTVAVSPFSVLDEPGVRKMGWGLAYSPEDGGENPDEKQASDPPQGLRMAKSPFPTWEKHPDFPAFEAVAEQVANSRPRVLMAHLREYHDLPEVTLTRQTENVHPFRQGDWALAHHGDLPVTLKEALDERLQAWHAKNPDTPLPQGDVDSERLACYMAARFRQTHGTQRIGELPTAQVRTDIKQFLHELDELGGRCATFNLVMSDGRRIFATHRSMFGSKLNLGRHRNAEGLPELLLATDKMQPTRKSGLSRIDWEPVPQQSLVSMERATDAQGVPQVEYHTEPLEPGAVGLTQRLKKGFSWPRRLWNGVTKLLGSWWKAICRFFRRSKPAES